MASFSPLAWVGGHLRQVGALEGFEVIAAGDRCRPPSRRWTSTSWPSHAWTSMPRGRWAVPSAAQVAGLGCIAIANAFVEPAALYDADVVLTIARDLALVDALSQVRTAPHR